MISPINTMGKLWVPIDNNSSGGSISYKITSQ